MAWDTPPQAVAVVSAAVPNPRRGHKLRTRFDKLEAWRGPTAIVKPAGEFRRGVLALRDNSAQMHRPHCA